MNTAIKKYSFQNLAKFSLAIYECLLDFASSFPIWFDKKIIGRKPVNPDDLLETYFKSNKHQFLESKLGRLMVKRFKEKERMRIFNLANAYKLITFLAVCIISNNILITTFPPSHLSEQLEKPLYSARVFLTIDKNATECSLLFRKIALVGGRA
jgi:hypothetical protein